MKNTILLLAILLLGQSSRLVAQSETNTKIDKARQASLVLAALLKNEQAKRVIIAGIRTGYYPDEAVLFRDLMNPGASPVFQKNPYLGGVPATAFAAAFRDALSRGQYPQSEQYASGQTLEAFLIDNNAQIYFPYSDNFDLNTVLNATVTFYPGDEPEANGGWRLERNQQYSDVVVNEPFVMANPTLIVNYFNGNPDLPSVTTGPLGAPAEVHPSAGGACEQPPHRMAVKVEDIYFASQWDNLFNGGPEFYFCRGELTYSGDGNQIGAVPNSCRISLKRKYKGEWHTAQADWDTRWEFINDEFEENNQQFAVYEDDHASNTSFSLTGTVSGEVKIPKGSGTQVSVSPSVTHNITADDEVIINTQWDRCWFISTNATDQGMGMRNGKAIRGVAGSDAVKFTMKITPY